MQASDGTTNKKYRRTLVACYLGFITQAIAANFAPLLFLTFKSTYEIGLEKLALIPLTFYLTQFLVDFAATKFVDKIGYRFCVVSSQALSAAGFVLLTVLPDLLPAPFLGILIAVVLYAMGSGLVEVLISPIVEACPFENKDGMMSLLHSFYCWGAVGVVLGSTLFFAVFGIENWKILTLIWAAIPFVNIFNFIACPIERLVDEGESMRPSQLVKLPLFWLLILLMACAGASEAAMAQWASAFTESAMGVSKVVGDLAGPCLFAAFMGTSRILYGKMSKKARPEQDDVGMRHIVRDLLSDGVAVRFAYPRAGRLRVVRFLCRHHVAGHDQYLFRKVSGRRHGDVRFFGFGGGSGCDRGAHYGRWHCRGGGRRSSDGIAYRDRVPSYTYPRSDHS